MPYKMRAGSLAASMDVLTAEHSPEAVYRERHARLLATDQAFEAAVAAVLRQIGALAAMAAEVDRERTAVLHEALRLIDSGVRVPRPGSLSQPSASICGAGRNGPRAAVAAICAGAKDQA